MGAQPLAQHAAKHVIHVAQCSFCALMHSFVACILVEVAPVGMIATLRTGHEWSGQSMVVVGTGVFFTR